MKPTHLTIIAVIGAAMLAAGQSLASGAAQLGSPLVLRALEYEGPRGPWSPAARLHSEANEYILTYACSTAGMVIGAGLLAFALIKSLTAHKK